MDKNLIKNVFKKTMNHDFKSKFIHLCMMKCYLLQYCINNSEHGLTISMNDIFTLSLDFLIIIYLIEIIKVINLYTTKIYLRRGHYGKNV